MAINLVIFSLIIGYLVGSISFTRIVVRLAAPKTDLTHMTISVPGVSQPMAMNSYSANTVGLALGSKFGALVGLLDMLKVFLITLGMRLVFPSQPYYVITALGGVLGHNWPIYYGFKGGRGISATYGGLFAVDPLGALSTSVAGMLIALFILRDFALIFPLSLLLVIPWMVLRTWESVHIAYAVLINLLFIIAIIPELKEVVRSRKEKGGAGTMQEMMETNPMGRSMLKIARRFGWLK
jgi:glycerol-3-phosphate acyltransferase PlsY